MSQTNLGGMLLSSEDPERLHAWYTALDPVKDAKIEQYHMLKFGEFYLMIDQRDDVTGKNPQPGRVILNFDVPDAQATAKRLEAAGATWLSPLEDRDGSFFATAIDPDGNYVQIIQLSEKHLAEMANEDWA